jgi:hypothetical protein
MVTPKGAGSGFAYTLFYACSSAVHGKKGELLRVHRLDSADRTKKSDVKGLCGDTQAFYSNDSIPDQVLTKVLTKAPTRSPTTAPI